MVSLREDLQLLTFSNQLLTGTSLLTPPTISTFFTLTYQKPLTQLSTPNSSSNSVGLASVTPSLAGYLSTSLVVGSALLLMVSLPLFLLFPVVSPRAVFLALFSSFYMLTTFLLIFLSPFQLLPVLLTPFPSSSLQMTSKLTILWIMRLTP